MEVLKTEEFMTLNDDGKQKGTEKTKSPEEIGKILNCVSHWETSCVMRKLDFCICKADQRL